jgi:hypothetical protein
VTNAVVGGVLHGNDHRTIFGTLNMRTIKRQAFTREMWDFKYANFDLFREELSRANWDSCLDSYNIDTVCDRWTKMFTNISEQCVKKKES